jgi:DNA-binding MarR family transcriptional regulator
MSDHQQTDLNDSGTQNAEERLARLVRLAARAFNRSLQIRLSTEGVLFGHWIFLRILWREDGLSQRELSERAHLTEPTAHSTLLRMEKLGYVSRRNMDGNKRRQHVFLTPEGWALRDKLEPLAVDANAVATRGLGEDELKTLRHALVTIIGNLERDEDEAAQRGLRVPPTRGSGSV